MRLTNIRLHPFGHFTDASWNLAGPLVVIRGPNEQGKTTLRQGVFHVLFTPTRLTKTKLEDTVGPWLPLPAGDYAQVTLTFEHDGIPWTLEKRWGAGASSRLGDGTTSIADPASVQARLGEMLEHGEATFRHVLFTGQMELEQTLVAIKRNAAEMRDIRDLLNAASGAAADVDEHTLRRLLEERIEAALSRWDDTNGKPERQNGQEKVGDNRWKKEVGTILKAWYAWQDRVDEHAQLLGIERDIDRVTREVAEIEQAIRDRDAYVEKHASLRTGLSERGELEERTKRLGQQVAALRAAFTGWPTAQAGIAAWDTVKPDIESQLGALKEELATARTRQAGAATIAAFDRIEQAKKAWNAADEEASRHPHPDDSILGEIQKLVQSITDATNKLAARALSWRIRADAPRQATVVRGGDVPEAVALRPEGTSGTAQGKVQVAVDGITFTVESGEDDVDLLFQSLAEARERLATSLRACGAASVAEAELMANRYRDWKTTAANSRKVYEALLQGKTFEQWQLDVQAMKTLPPTRDINVIEKEIAAKQKFLSEGEASVSTHRISLASWKEQYSDHATVGMRLLADQNALTNAEEQLKALPRLPEGFDSVEAFITAVEAAQVDQNAKRDEMNVKSSELTALSAQLGDRRSEDVAEETEVARRTFERARAQGRAYLRIHEELDRIAAGRGDGLLEAFAAKVAEMFSRITGREATVAFDGPLPTSVERGGVSLQPERLSQGASGALALALRLAMAEAYLDGGTGFIMLDDPLVNLDATRMGQAADIIRSFSRRSQVIFFTCHDHQAATLEATVGADQSPAGANGVP